MALSAGMTGGFAVHFMKKSRQNNSPFSVYLSACIFGMLLSGISISEYRNITGLKAWGLLGAVGVLAFLGQIIMTYGYKYVTATKGSIMGFTETIATIGLSYWLTGEEMKPRFWLGTLLIILGLLINQNIFRSKTARFK